MLIKTTLTRSQLEAVMASTNAHYDNNLQFRDFQDVGTLKRSGLKQFRFTLRVKSSRGPGARSAVSGRRTVNATWDAHRDFYTYLFDADSTATVSTSVETYKGREDFEQKYPDTAYHNVGSIMYPAHLGDL